MKNWLCSLAIAALAIAPMGALAATEFNMPEISIVGDLITISPIERIEDLVNLLPDGATVEIIDASADDDDLTDILLEKDGEEIEGVYDRTKGMLTLFGSGGAIDGCYTYVAATKCVNNILYEYRCVSGGWWCYFYYGGRWCWWQAVYASCQ